MQVSKSRLKMRSLIMYHKNSTDKIFRDQIMKNMKEKLFLPLQIIKRANQVKFTRGKRIQMIPNEIQKFSQKKLNRKKMITIEKI